MSHHPAIGPGVPGFSEGPPHVRCDAKGCDAVRVVRMDRIPPLWFLDGRAPPGWKLIRHADETRTDYCPMCKEGAPDAR